jgi:hypothetical protein
MAFDGSEGAYVSLTVASEWTANYRDEHPNEVKAHFFGKNKIQEILDQAGCMGIRIYYAIDGDDKKQLVMVGADADGNDMTSGGKILDVSIPCPHACSGGSSLNG